MAGLVPAIHVFAAPRGGPAQGHGCPVWKIKLQNHPRRLFIIVMTVLVTVIHVLLRAP
jgi:hypothetical protein